MLQLGVNVQLPAVEPMRASDVMTVNFELLMIGSVIGGNTTCAYWDHATSHDSIHAPLSASIYLRF